MRPTLHPRTVPLTGGTPERCPYGACSRPATTALVTGPVRGVHCDQHAVTARRNHLRALRNIGLLAPDPDAPVTYVGLVGCSASKRPDAQPARDLYTSPLFRKASAYVEDTCERWYVLSARHGLVHPDTVLAPYDVHLGANQPSSPPIWDWAYAVATALDDALAEVEHPHLVVLAGEHYRTALTLTPYPHSVPLAGLGIGAQLGWLTRQERERAQP